LGRAGGITEEQLQALPVYKQSNHFSPQEKLVLDYAVAMTETPVEVPDELFASLAKYFSEPQIVELTAAISWENYRARFNHALGMESQNFSETAFCPLPERPQFREHTA
jgi:4-carboxymuconolactone decarboxylase